MPSEAQRAQQYSVASVFPTCVLHPCPYLGFHGLHSVHPFIHSVSALSPLGQLFHCHCILKLHSLSLCHTWTILLPSSPHPPSLDASLRADSIRPTFITPASSTTVHAVGARRERRAGLALPSCGERDFLGAFYRALPCRSPRSLPSATALSGPTTSFQVLLRLSLSPLTKNLSVRLRRPSMCSFNTAEWKARALEVCHDLPSTTFRGPVLSLSVAET